MKLYAPFGNFRTNKIMVTAEFMNVQMEQHYVDLSTIKEKDFMKKSPLGKIPVLEVYGKGMIFESNAIVRFLARQDQTKGLYGNNEYEQALVDQWLDFCSLELEPCVQQLIMPIQGWIQFDSDKNERAQADLYNSMRVLEDNLAKTKGFMIASEKPQQITLADLAIACVLVNPYRYIFVQAIRQKFVLVSQWFDMIINHASFKKVWGKIWLCQEELVTGTVKKQKPEQKEDHQQNNNQQSPQKQPKKPKPQYEKAAKTEEVKESQTAASESKFNFFDFKTLYVNEPDKKKAIQYLWDNFDEKNFSLWKVNYIKAEGDGTVLFRTSNLYKGFLQRLDHIRKKAFGVFGIYGEETLHDVKGVFMFASTEILPEVKELDSYEFHTFDKLDPKNPAHRQVVEEYWSKQQYEDIVEGCKVQDVKYFK